MPVVSGAIHAYKADQKIRAMGIKEMKLTPERVLIVFPTRPISDLRFQMPKNA